MRNIKFAQNLIYILLQNTLLTILFPRTNYLFIN